VRASPAGAVVGNTVEIQGDLRDRFWAALEKKGLEPSRVSAGGPTSKKRGHMWQPNRRQWGIIVVPPRSC
jgi:hypothetical protein